MIAHSFSIFKAFFETGVTDVETGVANFETPPPVFLRV
jgi:hypothetical protein